MEIEIINWNKYNPRSDYKSIPWFRCDSEIAFTPALWNFTHAEKWVWITLLCLAAKKNKNIIKAPIDYICHISKTNKKDVQSAIEKLNNSGLIQSRTPCVRDANATRSLRNETIRNDTIRNDTNIYIVEQAKRVIIFLNTKFDRSFGIDNSTFLKLISARIRETNFKTCLKVILIKSRDQFFIDNKKYQSPKTLFAKSNFDNYREQPRFENSTTKNSVQNNYKQNADDLWQKNQELVAKYKMQRGEVNAENLRING